ncbi:MAG: hypothetical protein FWG12_00465 [Holophagaceae bacterium]|nr:hypothetical protein [Holophagaceae bacterium]
MNTIKSSSQPTLLVFEQDANPLAPSFRKLLQDEGISDLGLRLSVVPQVVRGPSASGDPSISLRRLFALGPSIRWVVVDSKEQVLFAGSSLPDANEFAQQLATKGVQSPLSILRQFLKTHPDHLDARVELLHLQLKNADKRTRELLDIEPEPVAQNPLSRAIGNVASPAGEMPGNSFTAVMNVRTAPGQTATLNFTPSGGASADAPKPKPIPADKVLDTVADLTIWSGYAESLDRLFVADDWIAVGLVFERSDYPIEVCSPLLKGLYRRKIGQVEAALEIAPGDSRLWSIWIRMADVVGGRSILAVVERLAQQPGNDFSSWPEDVRKKLVTDARNTSKWNFLAEHLWSVYERASKTNVSYSAESTAPGFNQNEALRRMMDSIYTDQWENVIEPLLEALIRMNDEGRADVILDTLKGRGETHVQRAMGLANRCDRPDLALRWGIFVTEKEAEA